MNQLESRFKTAAIMWLLLVITLSSVAVNIGLKFDSSIMTLLPKSQQQPVVQAATEQMADRFSKRLLLILSGEDEEKVRSSIAVLADHLALLDDVSKVDWKVEGSDLEQIQSELYPYRFSILDKESRSRLLSNDFDLLKDRALMQLYSPLSAGKTNPIDDPFSLFSAFQQSQKNDLNIQVSNSLLKVTHTALPTYLLMVSLSEQPFSPALQKRVLGAIAEHNGLLKESNIQLQMSGMLLHAELGARQANSEISTIGIGSILGILIMMLMIFHQLKPILLIFFAITLGCLTAASVTMLVFGQIHLITLAFGAGLVGVSIDYSLHFLCERRISPPQKVLQRILPGLLLGLFSSVIAYTAQAASPFPGLQQMAVFSAVGLAASWLTVVLWFPLLTQNDPLQPLATENRLNAIRNKFPRIEGNAWLILIILLMVGASLKVIINSENLDDIRLLQTSPDSLLKQETDIQQLLGSSSSTQFFLIKGETLEACLQKEERISLLLDKLISEQVLGGYQALSEQLPSAKRQDENITLVQQLYDQQLRPLYDTIHFSDEKASEALLVLQQQGSYLLKTDDWFQKKVSERWHDLRILTEDGHVATIIRFTGTFENETKQALISLSESEDGVVYIDQVQNISNMMTTFRSEITQLIMVAYLVVFLVLLSRYKSQVWRVILPPLLASIFTLALLIHFEQGLNVFHLMALILVLGIGLDMGIFLSESENSSHTWLAVSLSTVTSLLAFGLLAFSKTPVLHHFGLTVLMGLTLVWLLTPIMRTKRMGKI